MSSDDWVLVELGDVTELTTGYPFPSERYSADEADVKLLRGDNIAPGSLRWEGVQRWPRGNADAFEAYSLNDGDIVIAMDRPWISAGLKRARVFRHDLPCLLVQRVARIRARDDVDAAFLYHVTAMLRFSHYLLSEQTGTGVPHISAKQLNKFKFRLPPLSEQQKIAQILGTWDKAIATVEQLIAALERRKKGLMQRLLSGKARFPEFMPQNWRTTDLAEFFTEFSKRNSNGHDLTVLSCSKVHGIVPQTVIFDKRVASVDTSRYKVVEEGDLVYDPMLLWDASIGFVEGIDRGIISPAYKTFKFSESAGNRDYFKYLLKTHYYTAHYEYISQGTNVRRRKAPVEAFLGLPVKIPRSRGEQDKIAEALTIADTQIEGYRHYRELLDRQKKGLMQRLLTGQVRVNAQSTALPDELLDDR